MSKSKILFGFTLIEMLVVIAMIALLASIMAPVVEKAKEAAKKNDIRHQVSQLKTSWELSFVELKKFPNEVWGEMEQDAVRYLAGNNDLNFKYMDFNTNEMFNASVTNGMRDKFYGKPYHIALDHLACPNDNGKSYDGIVMYKPIGGPDKALDTHVAVWHDWKDDGSEDDIRSWKDFK